MRAAVLLLALVATPARAEPPRSMSLVAGGGVSQFARGSMQTMTEPGAFWEVRAGLGTRSSIGIEIAYLGSARRIYALGLDRDAVLLSTAFEADLRLPLLEGTWLPYFLVGAAWKRYALARVTSNTSDVDNGDQVLEIPTGLGLAWRKDGLIVDTRLVYRLASEGGLVPAAHERGGLDTFEASLDLGYEF